MIDVMSSFCKVIPVSICFDLSVFALVMIWLIGGIPYGDTVLLRHGADPRRAAILLIFLGWLFFTALRKKSFFIRIASVLWEKLQQPRIRWFLLVVVFVWAAVLGVLQTLAMRFPMYDVGLFHQILWNLAHGNGFLSTISGAGNFLLDHSSVSLVLLTPFYWLTGGSPLIISTIHAMLIFTGVAAWLFLAERVSGLSSENRQKLAAAVLVFAVSFDSLWANMRWGFHENSIAFAALSWAMALLFLPVRKRTIGKFAIIGLFIIAAGAKEILLVDVALALTVWGFWEASEQKGSKRVLWLSVLLFFAISLVLLFVAFERLPHPADKNYFQRYYSYLGLDLNSFWKSIFSSPRRILDTIGFTELLRYKKTLLLPFLGLPAIWFFLVFKKSWRSVSLLMIGFIICVLPSALSAGLSTYAPLRQSGFHYVLEIWPVFAVVTILGFAAIHLYWSPRVYRILLIAWVFVSLFSLGQDPWNQLFGYWRGAKSAREVRIHLSDIQSNQAVIADEMTGTWLSGRPMITKWPASLPGGRCPDWFVLKEGDIPPSVCAVKVEWLESGWVGFRVIGSRTLVQ